MVVLDDMAKGKGLYAKYIESWTEGNCSCLHITKDFGFLSNSSDAFIRKLANLEQGWSDGLGAEVSTARDEMGDAGLLPTKTLRHRQVPQGP